jgi:hypothetical protein
MLEYFGCGPASCVNRVHMWMKHRYPFSFHKYHFITIYATCSILASLSYWFLPKSVIIICNVWFFIVRIKTHLFYM